jgi:mono/diheme cytochrome c family protein
MSGDQSPLDVVVRLLNCTQHSEEPMVRDRKYWSTLLVTAVTFTIAMATASTGAARDTREQGQNNAALGGYLFKTYCASCHGTSARGDGPLADAMRRKPANLLEITTRNKGTFPSELVYKIIDGRTKVAGHGGPDMPVWGDAFLRTADGTDEASVKHRIQALVDYLQSIQARNTQ